MRLSWVVFLLVLSDATAKPQSAILFPTEDLDPVRLRSAKPAECPNGANFCGVDDDTYPHQLINALLSEQFLESQVAAQWLLTPTTSNSVDSPVDPPELTRCCEAATELMPQNARARNVLGKWLFIVQGAKGGGAGQQVETVICRSPGKPCLNDLDSPYGERTTVCRQLYTTHKLLALDENNSLVIDTFSIPSACLCKQEEVALQTRSIANNEIDIEINFCKNDTATFSVGQTESQSARTKRQVVFPTSAPKPMTTPTPCSNGLFCEDHDAYPTMVVQSQVRSERFISRKDIFSAIFTAPCETWEAETTCDDTCISLLRTGLNVLEHPLCQSQYREIRPQVALNVHGQWRLIVNTKDYQQTITIEECRTGVQGKNCNYGGQEGNFPQKTVCKQNYASHKMVAIDENGRLVVEVFRLPSACVCHMLDKCFFVFNDPECVNG